MLPIHFAPLQGYTEDAYRRLHYELMGGVAEYYTPFVRLEHGEVRSKDLRDIRPENNVREIVTPQIIVNGGEEMCKLLEVVLPMGYQRIDVNMGCPFPLQTRHGRGAGILSDVKKVKEVCEIIRNTSNISFSVKMRLGLNNNDEWKHILPILNDTPLRHITLHPRIASQQYKGEVDMTAFEAFAQSCQHPLIYNGDLQKVEDIQRLEEHSPTLSGVMIGRGLLARPSLAIEYVTGKTWNERQIIDAIRQMHDLLMAYYQKIIPGETQQLTKLRTFWDYMEPTLGRKQWKKVVKAGNMKNYLAAVSSL